MFSYFSSGTSHLILFKLLIEKWGVVRKTFVNWLNHLFKNSSFFGERWAARQNLPLWIDTKVISTFILRNIVQ